MAILPTVSKGTTRMSNVNYYSSALLLDRCAMSTEGEENKMEHMLEVTEDFFILPFLYLKKLGTVSMMRRENPNPL